MVKSILIQRMWAQNPHLRQSDVEKIMNVILGALTAAMARGDRIELRGLGSFGVRADPPAPAAIRAPAPTSQLKRRPCRSSGPARKCASGSTHADDLNAPVAWSGKRPREVEQPGPMASSMTLGGPLEAMPIYRSAQRRYCDALRGLGEGKPGKCQREADNQLA
jgi:Bacterial DNA-binding protein